MLCAGKHPAHCCGTGSSPPQAATHYKATKGAQGAPWDGDYGVFFSLLRLFDAIWSLRALVTTITQYQQQPWQSWLCFWREPGFHDPLSTQDLLQFCANQIYLFSKTLLSKAADALLSEDAAVWHLLSRWRWWRCISRTAIIYGHNFKIGSKSLWSLPWLIGAPWDCLATRTGPGMAESSLWQQLSAAQYYNK